MAEPAPGAEKLKRRRPAPPPGSGGYLVESQQKKKRFLELLCNLTQKKPPSVCIGGGLFWQIRYLQIATSYDNILLRYITMR